MRQLILALALLTCGLAYAQEPVPAPTTLPDATTAPATPEVTAPAVVQVEPAPVVVVPAPDVVAPAPPVTPVAEPVVVTSTTTPAAPLPAAPTTTVAGPPKTDAEAGTFLGAMVDAAKDGHWNVVGGLLILLLIWLFNKLGMATKLGSKLVPWVSVALGVLATLGVGLATGAPLLAAIKTGALNGALAVALWELVGKHFLTAKTPPPAA